MFLFLFLYTVYGLVKKKKEMANKDFETKTLKQKIWHSQWNYAVQSPPGKFIVSIYVT